MEHPAQSLDLAVALGVPGDVADNHVPEQCARDAGERVAQQQGDDGRLAPMGESEAEQVEANGRPVKPTEPTDHNAPRKQ